MNSSTSYAWIEESKLWATSVRYALESQSPLEWSYGVWLTVICLVVLIGPGLIGAVIQVGGLLLASVGGVVQGGRQAELPRRYLEMPKDPLERQLWANREGKYSDDGES